MDNNSDEKFYKSIGKVYCPYFKEHVYFNIVIPLFKQKSPPDEGDGFSEHLATADCRDG